MYNIGSITYFSRFEWSLQKFGLYQDIYKTNSSLYLQLNSALHSSNYLLLWIICLESASSYLAKIEVCILSNTNEERYAVFIEKSQPSTVHFIKTNVLLNNRRLLTTDSNNLLIKIRI